MTKHLVVAWEYREFGQVSEVTAVLDDGRRISDRSSDHVEKLEVYARIQRMMDEIHD